MYSVGLACFACIIPVIIAPDLPKRLIRRRQTLYVALSAQRSAVCGGYLVTAGRSPCSHVFGLGFFFLSPWFALRHSAHSSQRTGPTQPTDTVLARVGCFLDADRFQWTSIKITAVWRG